VPRQFKLQVVVDQAVAILVSSGGRIRRSRYTPKPGVSGAAKPQSATPGPLTSTEGPLPPHSAHQLISSIDGGGSGPSVDHAETIRECLRNQACAAARRHLAVGSNGFAV